VVALSRGPQLMLADGKATARYFSIDAMQALAPGPPEFDAKDGVRSVGAGAQVRHQWTSQWSSRLYVEYDRLPGDAASSPVVAQRSSPDQVSVVGAIAYSFSVRPR
jgi:MipA family protein